MAPAYPRALCISGTFKPTGLCTIIMPPFSNSTHSLSTYVSLPLCLFPSLYLVSDCKLAEKRTVDQGQWLKTKDSRPGSGPGPKYYDQDQYHWVQSHILLSLRLCRDRVHGLKTMYHYRQIQ